MKWFLTLSVMTIIPACCFGQSSLGGLKVTDMLSSVFDTMKLPDKIQGKSVEQSQVMYAVMVYRRNNQVVVALTPDGDKVQNVLSMSPSAPTNDGIAVGDTLASVEAKRGKPEEVAPSVVDGQSEYWYWSQGINFGIDDKSQTVANIYIFAPPPPDISTDQAALRLGDIKFVHKYSETDRSSVISGTVINKSVSSETDVLLRIALLDDRNQTVSEISYQVGAVLAKAQSAFEIPVPRKGTWTHYTLTGQCGNPDGKSSARLNKGTEIDISKFLRH
jgi:hypothetical protein